MTQTLLPLLVFVILLAMVPFALKWLQRRTNLGLTGTGVASKVVSVIAVGPHQRVVTVEVGPPEARVWLTLGVTAQTISCLHSLDRSTDSRPNQMLEPNSFGPQK